MIAFIVFTLSCIGICCAGSIFPCVVLIITQQFGNVKYTGGISSGHLREMLFCNPAGFLAFLRLL